MKPLEGQNVAFSKIPLPRATPPAYVYVDVTSDAAYQKQIFYSSVATLVDSVPPSTTNLTHFILTATFVICVQ